jgi:hypothetical protein
MSARETGDVSGSGADLSERPRRLVDGLDRPPLPSTQRFFDNLFAFLNRVNDGVTKGKNGEKRAIIQTYWLQCRP